MDAKTEALTDGWQAEAEEQARALVDRAGIEFIDDYHDFVSDLESTLLEFAGWTHGALSCSCDEPQDLCAHHSPELSEAMADLRVIADEARAPHANLPDAMRQIAERAEAEARLSRLLGICRRIKWTGIGMPATHDGETQQAFVELAEMLFADGLDTALTGKAAR